MSEFVQEPCVELIAVTKLLKVPDEIDWTPLGTHSGQDLIEFAGRLSYHSYNVSKRRSQSEYIAHLLEAGHFSVLEHVNATFYISGVSRALTHELVRHRIASYTQRSQRYVDESRALIVVHPAFKDNPAALDILMHVSKVTKRAYEELLRIFNAAFSHIENPTERRKSARQAARMVLPNAVSTAIVMTANLREWRHFLMLRGSEHADAEIRQLALKIYEILVEQFPDVFIDCQVVERSDGLRYLRVGYPT